MRAARREPPENVTAQRRTSRLAPEETLMSLLRSPNSVDEPSRR